MRSSLDRLAEDTLGRLVLVTNRHTWTTEDIIRTYRSQASVEALFEHIKDPLHIALRPQFHWTDQKLPVHVFTCVLAHLLSRLLFIKGQRARLPYQSQEGLVEALERVRKATVIRRHGSKGKPIVSQQLEEIDPILTPHLIELGVTL